MKTTPLKLSLGELIPGACQVWGNIRIVPLVRERPIEDIRLARRALGAQGTVRLDGKSEAATIYSAYLPSALILGWSDDDSPLGLPETWVGSPEAVPRGQALSLHRIVKQLDHQRLRLLPLHVAIEGLLSAHFGGPDIAWKGLSDQVLRSGLSPRVESFFSGDAIAGLEEALRLFEIHDGQCGALVFVADALAAAFAVGHPDDYRALHHAMLEDLFAELLVRHGRLSYPLPIFNVTLDEAGVTDLASLTRALEVAEQGWRELRLDMAAGLLHRTVAAQRTRGVGRYQLMRFFTGTDETTEQHVGELLWDPDRGPVYLKTARLDAAQVRRAALLEILAKNGWNPKATAEAMALTPGELHSRLTRNGLGYVFSR